MKKIKSRLLQAFALDAVPMKNGVFEIWMPGGENFWAPIPRDGATDMLPPAIPWARRVGIAYGNKMFSAPNMPVTTLSYDIETLVSGPAPNPDRDRLKSIAWWSDDELWCRDCETDDDRRTAIHMFATAIAIKNPDVIMDYFGKYYDMPVLINEAARLGIDFPIGRDGSEPEIIRSRKPGRFGIYKIVIKGRVHLDVFNEACFDQSLNGVRKGLKPVSKHLKIKNIIIEDVTAIDNLASEARMLYNVSDARLTHILGTNYLRSLSSLAERLQIPLGLAVTRSPTHIGDYFYGRDHLKRGIDWRGTNADRFPQEFARKGKKYEGGFVQLVQSGLFRDAKKLDFNSLYPSTMAMFNLDPYTISVIRKRRVKSEYEPVFHSPTNDTNGIIEICDKMAGGRWCNHPPKDKCECRTQIAVDIDVREDSTTRIETLKLLKWKNELKPQSKVDPGARSNYWVVKLLLNANYGYHGAPWSNWGSLPIAYTTTAIGRWVVKGLRDLMHNPIGVDTDGVVGAGEDDMDAIEKALQERIPDYYMRELLTLDEDRIDIMLSVDEKNYITEERGKIKIHGSGLKGRHIPYAVGDALKVTVEALFEGKDPWAPLRRFVARFPDMKVRELQLNQDFGKAPGSYKKGAMMGQLAAKLVAAGIPVQKGDSCYYVKTVDGYTPTQLAGDAELDLKYYRERVAKIVARALSAVEEIKVKEVLKRI